ncbi:hypothetical protein HOI83_02175 [Candidatus Uhrbacteria bacterium]|jgi:hypothetical protein|nr:hypothetical protein [Candidatus Uhrbacteria bacterium]
MEHVATVFTTYGFTPDALPHLLLILFAGVAYGWATKTFKLQGFNLFAGCFTALASPILLLVWIAISVLSAMVGGIEGTVTTLGPAMILIGFFAGLKATQVTIDRATT